MLVPILAPAVCWKVTVLGKGEMAALHQKLHVYHRTRAVLYTIREGLVDVDGLEGS